MRSEPGTLGDRGARGARHIILCVALAPLMLLATPATAGTIDVHWDPVPDADLAGYHVYYGLTPGSHDNMQDAGKATQATLSGLADCTIWYVTVRAYDTGGLESANDSNRVHGWPRPVVAAVTPSEIEQGTTRTFTVTGTNFDPGDPLDPNHPAARVELSHPGLTVVSTSVTGCGELRVTIRAASNATPTTSDLTVLNPDLTYSPPDPHPWVFGTLAGALTVVPGTGGDTTPPEVVATDPAAGATGVPATVQPAVTFSEAVDPATVTPQTVRLVDAQGGAVPQAAGSPQLSGAVATIVPAQPLAAGADFHVEVAGGSAGVKDLAGNAMTSDFVQSPPFTTASGGSGEPPPPPAAPPQVTGSDPAPDTYGVPEQTSVVTVRFDRDMGALFAGMPQAELQAAFGVRLASRPLAQGPNSPRLLADGVTVVIDLAEPLRAGAAYTTEVRLAGRAMHDRLAQLGLSAFEMARVWTSRPAWRVAGGFASASWFDPQGAGSGSLAPGGRTLDPGNTGVPVTAEFRITFAEPVTAASAVPGVFQLAVETGGRHAEAVALVTPLPRLDGGRTVVLRPLSALPSGRRARITVRTGPNGVQLSGANGTHGLEGGYPIDILMATEVTASAPDAGLGVTTPRPPVRPGGGG